MDFTRYEFVRITTFLCLNYKIIRAPQNIAAKNAKRTPHKIVSHAGLWSQCTSELAVQSAALAYSIQRKRTVWAAQYRITLRTASIHSSPVATFHLIQSINFQITVLSLECPHYFVFSCVILWRV